MKVLCLYLDTNILLHCKPLHEADWSKYNQFDLVSLMVCRTVQKQVDELKYQAGGRRKTKRARKAASTLREILLQESPKELRPTSPKVILDIDSSIRPSQDCGNQLDYDHTDDHIVGYAYRYKAEYPEKETRLLSNDAGLMFTSRNLGMICEQPDVNWMLEPEQDDRDRKLQTLEEEIAILKSQEPVFEIQLNAPLSSEPNLYTFTYNAFPALAVSEQAEVLELMQRRYPPDLLFDPLIKKSDIDKYLARTYPNWIEKCRALLSEIHDIFQQEHMPSITIVVNNVGTRPAKKARISHPSPRQFQTHSARIKPERTRLSSDSHMSTTARTTSKRGF